MKRTISIADIHGCYREFMLLLEKLKYDEANDRLILAGDLVDRGPDSAAVVKWVREAVTRSGSDVHCVMGNHDDKHFRYFKHNLKRREHPNYRIPMRPFSMDKIIVQNSLEDEDLVFLGSLPPFIVLENRKWVVVHAGLEPGKSLEQQDMGKMTHIRFLDPKTLKTVSLDDNYMPPPGSIYWTDCYDGEYNVVYGHNVHSLDRPEITVKSNGTQLVGLDTGCCFGGRLSAFIMPETKEEKVTPDHFVQINAAKAYARSSWHST
jgi:diadenosine tetraphosphatase ApaH/serine/threonine PP2A family protein phosphatase